LSGREAELKKLQSWYGQAASGERQIVFIAGESGIGKTALTEAFLQAVAAQRKLRMAVGSALKVIASGKPITA
jgi:predicted ATPase